MPRQLHGLLPWAANQFSSFFDPYCPSSPASKPSFGWNKGFAETKARQDASFLSFLGSFIHPPCLFSIFFSIFLLFFAQFSWFFSVSVLGPVRSQIIGPMPLWRLNFIEWQLQLAVGSLLAESSQFSVPSSQLPATSFQLSSKLSLNCSQWLEQWHGNNGRRKRKWREGCIILLRLIDASGARGEPLGRGRELERVAVRWSVQKLG